MIVSMAFYDHTYLIDFTIEHLPLSKGGRSKQDLIVDFVVKAARQYEQADSMTQKCVGFRGAVMSDSTFKANMVTLGDHRALCGEATWAAMMKYATILKTNKTRIAAMRRFSGPLGVDLNWYVPKPRPGIFRSTKDMHNILQGVNNPFKGLTKDEQDEITDWITHNAQNYWLSAGGPLRPVEEGGANIIVVDNAQMPTLIPLIKSLTPTRPVTYRSHIEIRSDLIEEDGSPQKEAWGFLWEAIRRSDLFISHPIPEFVPREIPREMPLSKWASCYYLNLYNQECISHQMTGLVYPERGCIVQVARFDPAKGIPTVLDACAEFRRRADKTGVSKSYIPQLVIAGNGSIDDPDAGIVFDEALNQIQEKYPELLTDISIMRLQANDQLLNALILNARVVLQLSTREGFEVKVSEALHAGRPVIATRASGIPIQVKDRENTFLVEPEDYEAVAQHLVEICGDRRRWERMSHAASTGVSDKVGTVGNALCWYYLGVKLTVGDRKLAGDCRWINDLARTEAGYPYKPGENRLPRRFTEEKQQGVVS
ncbi:glycosyltransferase family 4 protein [Xylaria cf. heliscus]|nr:glycosyltransferase family 4 protein [Xylaria cf. heliscus]